MSILSKVGERVLNFFLRTHDELESVDALKVQWLEDTHRPEAKARNEWDEVWYGNVGSLTQVRWYLWTDRIIRREGGSGCRIFVRPEIKALQDLDPKAVEPKPEPEPEELNDFQRAERDYPGIFTIQKEFYSEGRLLEIKERDSSVEVVIYLDNELYMDGPKEERILKRIVLHMFSKPTSEWDKYSYIPCVGGAVSAKWKFDQYGVAWPYGDDRFPVWSGNPDPEGWK